MCAPSHLRVLLRSEARPHVLEVSKDCAVHVLVSGVLGGGGVGVGLRVGGKVVGASRRSDACYEPRGEQWLPAAFLGESGAAGGERVTRT